MPSTRWESPYTSLLALPLPQGWKLLERGYSFRKIQLHVPTLTYFMLRTMRSRKSGELIRLQKVVQRTSSIHSQRSKNTSKHLTLVRMRFNLICARMELQQLSLLSRSLSKSTTQRVSRLSLLAALTSWECMQAYLVSSMKRQRARSVSRGMHNGT